MSAFNVIVAPDGSKAWVLTDGACGRSYADETLVDVAMEKVWKFKGFILGARGCMGNIWPVVGLMLRYSDFDDAVERAPKAIRRVLWINAKRSFAKLGWRKPKDTDVLEIHLVGFSRSAGRVVAVMGHSESETAFTLQQGAKIFCPDPSGGYDEHGAMALSKDAIVTGKGVPEALLAVMKLQRQNYFENEGEPGAAPAEVIGGHAQMTTISKDAIEKTIIHVWPDRVGDRLCPNS